MAGYQNDWGQRKKKNWNGRLREGRIARATSIRVLWDAKEECWRV